jgi:Tol biopolymer transport system component
MLSRVGPYDIVGHLGAGGMGVVYRARDERLGREVAVKVLPEAVKADPERLRRFEQETRAAGALNHPNLLVVFDVGAHEGTPYLVTELLEGETLRQRLKSAPLPWKKAVELAAQLARGLAAAHEKGFVHRDLKPDNLFITKDGRAKILDFGLARAVSKDPSPLNQTLSQTASGQVLGTAGYMSPEQVRGHAATVASDIFAFGAVLFEMVSGQPAFPGETPVERGYAVLSKEVPAFATLGLDVPPGLERLVRRCLEKSPDERHQSAKDVAWALEGLLLDSTSNAATQGQAPVVPRRSRRAMLLAVLMLVLAAGLGVAISTATAPAPAKQPTFTRLNFRRGYVSGARFAPDGRSVIYGSALEGKLTQVFSATPDSPDAREIGPPGAGLLAVAPNGELALAVIPENPLQKGSTLAKAQLAGGAPRETIEGVDSADYSPDGSQLAVVRVLDGAMRLEYPPGTARAETQGYFSHPRLSHDGKRLAFLEHPLMDDDRGTVEVIELDTGKRTRLSGPWYSLGGLAWSADGREVWFAASDAQQIIRGLYAATLEGKTRSVLKVPGNLALEDIGKDGRVLLTSTSLRMRIGGRLEKGKKELDLSWFDGSIPVSLSRDGKMMLFVEGLQAARNEIQAYLRPTDGGPAVHLGQGWPRALSPDGKLALVSQTDPFDSLTLVPTGAGEARQLPRGDYGQIRSGAFSPDGTFVAFMAGREKEAARLWVQTLDGKPPRAVSAPGVVCMSEISKDGKVALVMSDGARKLAQLPEGTVEDFEALPPLHVPLAWSDDGEKLFLRAVPSRREATRPPELKLLDVESEKVTPFATIIPPDPMGLTLKMNKVLVANDGATIVYAYHATDAELYVVDGLAP